MPRHPDPRTWPLTGWSEPLSRFERHRQLLLHRVPRLSGEPVVSHLSAAVLYRWPLVGVLLTVLHVTRPGRAASRSSALMRTHGARLTPEEITEVDGLRVTTPARTLIDCLRMLPMPSGVILADAVLARGAVRYPDVAALAERPKVPGSHRTRRILAWSDPGSRTVDDSRARLAFLDEVSDPPRAHVTLPLGPGGSAACADLWLPDHGVVGVRLDADPLDPPCPAPRVTLRQCEIADQPAFGWRRSDLADPALLPARLQTLLDPVTAAGSGRESGARSGP